MNNLLNPNPAIPAFEAAVEAKRRLGLKQSAAVSAVVAADPSLHQEYLKAWNPGRGVGRQSAASGLQPAGPEAIAQWDRAIDAKRAIGRNQAQAVRELVHEQPELHRQYLAAFNTAHQPARR